MPEKELSKSIRISINPQGRFINLSAVGSCDDQISRCADLSGAACDMVD
jgi:hypothetical protein